MKDRFFLDTNIFVYAYESESPQKQQTALKLMRSATDQLTGVVSYQVIQEFLNVVLLKTSKKMSYEEAQQFIVHVFQPLITVHSSIELFSDAIFIRGRYKFSWYDSLIVAAAQKSDCGILYTEDLQHGQRLGDVLVQNPFL